MPKEMKEIFRPCKIAQPDTEFVLRQLMRLSGFSKDGELIHLIMKFHEMSISQIVSRPFGLPLYELKEIIREAGDNLPAANNEREAFLISLSNYVMPQLSEKEKFICQSLIVNIFGPNVQPAESEEAHRLVVEYFKVRDLTMTPSIERNILDCYEVVSRWSACHIQDSDLPGSDICFDCVKHLLAKISHRHVLSKTIYPKVYSLGELFGEYVPRTSGQGQEFKSGVIQLVIRELTGQYPSAMDEDLGRMHTIYSEKNIERWVVLDGTASSDWVEGISPAVDSGSRSIVLPNYEKLKIAANLKIFLRSENLHQVTPAIAVRLGKVRPGADYSWQQQLEKELNKMIADYPMLLERQIGSRLKGWTSKFFESLFDGKGHAAFDWIMRPTNLEVINSFTTTFKILLSDFLNSSFERDDHLTKLDSIVSSYMFVSIGFAVGSLVSPQHVDRFEQLVEDRLAHCMTTDNKHILSKGISPKTYQADLCEKIFDPQYIDINFLDELKISPQLRVLSSMEVWQATALGKIAASKKNILFLADGRPSIRRLLGEMMASAVAFNNNLQIIHTKWTVDFKALDLLDQLKKSLTPRNKFLYVAKSPAGAVLLAEDINMPPKDRAGDIVSLELLRCLLRDGNFYDTSLGEPVKFEGLQCTMTLDMAVSSAAILSRRYRRKFAVLGLQGNADANFRSSIYEIVSRYGLPMLPDYFEKDMLIAVCHKSAEVIHAVTAEFRKFPSSMIPKDVLHPEKVADLVASSCSVKALFEREDQLISFTLGQYILYLKMMARNMTDGQINSTILNATSKVYRSFDPQSVRVDRYLASVLVQAPGSNRLSLEEGGAETFKKQVAEVVTSTKEFRDFALLPEPLEALHGCLRLLAMGGSRLILEAAGDPRQLIGIASRLMKFEFVELDLSPSDQIASVSAQLTKILEEALSRRKWRVIFLRLGGMKNLGVLRLLQDTILLGDVSKLSLDIASVRDAIFAANLENVDEGVFVQSVWNHRCRFVFLKDKYSDLATQEMIDSFLLIKSSLGPLSIPEWQTSSLISVAIDVMERFEELDMSPEEKQVAGKCLAEIYLYTKVELKKHGVEIQQASFNNSCHYACEIRARAKSEIKDQLRNLQTAISRFRALNRLRDELVAIEGAARLKLKEKEKILEEVVKALDLQNKASRQQKE